MDKINHQIEHFEQISKKYFNARQDKNHLAYKTYYGGIYLNVCDGILIQMS